MTARNTSPLVEVRAELVANVWKHVAHVGDRVRVGDVLSVLESMKMEIPVLTEIDGVIAEQRVPEGTIVQEGDVLWVIDSSS
ncbi:biotin/lipoyl-binding carrier protein [soil metagenome]